MIRFTPEARRAAPATGRVGIALTAIATGLVLVLITVLIGALLWMGGGQVSTGFLTGGATDDMFDPRRAGILPMIIGTAARVILMTLFVIPVGVLSAIYLFEYAPRSSRLTKVIRAAVFHLAGVPSIVFGLFGVGFFVSFVGGHLDVLAGSTEPRWGKPGLLWASLTMGIMTLPVVILATEEALNATPRGIREASLALGASRLATVFRIVLPNALPGILTGGILAVSRAAGEVTPILFTGAAFYLRYTRVSPTDQFMDLAYHIYLLTTQSPDVEQTRPILFGTALVLLTLTFGLNLAAILLRAEIRDRLESASDSLA